MDAEQFARDREIDPAKLDLAAATQPDLFFRYAQEYVAARSKAEKRKLRMELCEYRLSLQCRSKPENFGLVRVTDAAVIAAVHTHKDYITAFKSYIEAREEALLLEKAVDAMEQRKRMIEVLITLHGQQYFAGPSVPRDLVGSYREYLAERSVRVRDRLRPNVRKRKKKATTL